MPSPANLPDSGVESWFPALQVDSLPSEPPGKSSRQVASHPFDSTGGDPNAYPHGESWGMDEGSSEHFLRKHLSWDAMLGSMSVSPHLRLTTTPDIDTTVIFIL